MNVFYDEQTQTEIDAAQSVLDAVSQSIIDKMTREEIDPQMMQRIFLEDPMRNELIGLICDLRANATKVTYSVLCPSCVDDKRR